MENAGRSVAEFIQRKAPNIQTRRIVILCGKGNNGGDGFVVARHLQQMGAKPSVFLAAVPDDLRGDAAANLSAWRNANGQLNIVRSADDWKSQSSNLAQADVIIDALLGTGVRGPVEGLLAQIIEDVNRHSAAQTVFAVDIPSGLPADTGEILGPIVRADFTITFTAPKVGMLQGQAGDYVGELIVHGIGSPPDLIEEIGKGTLRWSEPREFAQFAASRKPAGNKGDYGHALIVAGALGKSGAAVPRLLVCVARGSRIGHRRDSRTRAANSRQRDARDNDGPASCDRNRKRLDAAASKINFFASTLKGEASTRNRPRPFNSSRNAAVRSRRFSAIAQFP